MDDDMVLFINVNTELIDGTMIGNRWLIFFAPSGDWRDDDGWCVSMFGV